MRSEQPLAPCEASRGAVADFAVVGRCSSCGSECRWDSRGICNHCMPPPPQTHTKHAPTAPTHPTAHPPATHHPPIMGGPPPYHHYLHCHLFRYARAHGQAERAHVVGQLCPHACPYVLACRLRTQLRVRTHAPTHVPGCMHARVRHARTLTTSAPPPAHCRSRADAYALPCRTRAHPYHLHPPRTPAARHHQHAVAPPNAAAPAKLPGRSCAHPCRLHHPRAPAARYHLRAVAPPKLPGCAHAHPCHLHHPHAPPARRRLRAVMPLKLPGRARAHPFHVHHPRAPPPARQHLLPTRMARALHLPAPCTWAHAHKPCCMPSKWSRVRS
jgi:hypothetical protein